MPFELRGGTGAASRVIGILNVTPDSFSDGGLFDDVDEAIRHGMKLVAQGADIVDVGGESTRPGAARVPESLERARVLPVVSALASAGVCVSIDTTRAAVAEDAVAHGAVIINDVSGGLADRRMAWVAADTEATFVAMHWRGHSEVMAKNACYHDVVGEVTAELRDRIEALVDAGVRERRIVIDPGLGFAKAADHNWELLAGLDRLLELGRPVLVGASRKSFLGELARTAGHPPPPPHERDDITCAVSALAAAAGVWGIRAHNVVSTRRAVAVAAAVAPAKCLRASR